MEIEEENEQYEIEREFGIQASDLKQNMTPSKNKIDGYYFITFKLNSKLSVIVSFIIFLEWKRWTMEVPVGYGWNLLINLYTLSPLE